MFGVRWTCSLKQTNCKMKKEHKGWEKIKKGEGQKIEKKEMTLRNVEG